MSVELAFYHVERNKRLCKTIESVALMMQGGIEKMLEMLLLCPVTIYKLEVTNN